MVGFRRLSITTLLIAISLTLGTVHANSTTHYGPYPSTSTDSGTCGPDWANDTFDRHFYVTANPDGSHLVIERFKEGSFVTFAGVSPGSCPPTDQTSPGTVPAGVTGPLTGFFIIPIDSSHGQTSYNSHCNGITGMDSNCDTMTFIETHFSSCAYQVTCSVTSFFFHYIATSNQCLSERDWKNASPDQGGNVGDIRSGPPCTPVCPESDGNGDFQGQQNGNFNFDNDGCRDGDQNQVSSTNRGDGKDFQSTQIDTTSFDPATNTLTITGLGTSGGVPVAFTFVALETGLTTPGWVSFAFSDGYTNAGTLVNGSVLLH